jgi:hypothetical protein
MSERETKVVGYFAYLSPTQVVCSDVDACVVSGSIKAMEEYLTEIDPLRTSKATVKKTRFGEIRRGLQLGAAYAFDKEPYARFYPLAVEAGVPVAAAGLRSRATKAGGSSQCGLPSHDSEAGQRVDRSRCHGLSLVAVDATEDHDRPPWPRGVEATQRPASTRWDSGEARLSCILSA